MAFEFLKKYVVDENSNIRLRHTFHSVEEEVIQQIDSIIKIPVELKKFYHLIGYGFMLDIIDRSIDRFLDPFEFKRINLREDYYQFDPTLELFSLSMYENKLIFFEVNEGVYLLIDKQDINKKNAIYYFDKKIANSLEEFLLRFDKEPYYFEK